ncbi:transcriptional regulator with XRE-family HTH domain [Actinomadura coerulea]|uniref:Transcriptional regulator with XRE-family HTH domain n=1 Tax=Actinomadura coerulea TaxID=46159 RepID=A0A7X0FXD3_9ACTN|nr:helix-turn-helix transcriptional regulator [Actinomadura coerulea]MBB6394882.1 transcriptional regulator with XRE-family HTH domain [Actinomadura coerulea]GGQ31412.1 transcriptional regulator [Actinomadura coerulea]
MHQETTIGARLRALRRWRGMTLDQLAGQAGLSKSFLSMAERGQRSLDRRSHIAALADALRVSETDLVGGPHLGPDPVQSRPHTYIPALRTALETNGFHQGPAVERARPVPALAALMNGPIEQHRRRYDYVGVGEALPDLIDELHWHVSESADEPTQRLALETLVEAYMCAAGMARALRHPDLGHVAAMRADETAVLLDDPIARGKAAFSLVRPNASNWHRVKGMAERAANRLEPHVKDQAGRQVLGMLTLNAALASAASRDLQSAEHWLREARALSGHVPDDLEGNWQAFGRTNVAIWYITVGVEAGKGGREIAELAGAVDVRKLEAHPGRKTCFLADVGRGMARDPRHRDEAIGWFERSEEAAPQRFRNDPKIRESIAVMLEQARVASQGRELRGMAARMGLLH